MITWRGRSAFITIVRISSSTRCAVASLTACARSASKALPGLAIGERTERRHAELADHVLRDVGGALDVVRRAARHVVHEELFGHPAAHQDGDLRFQETLGVRVTVRLRQLHRDAHGPAARNDRDLVQRIGLRQQRGDDGVSGLVIGAVDAVVLAQDDRAPLGPHQHFVPRLRQIRVDDRLRPARAPQAAPPR